MPRLQHSGCHVYRGCAACRRNADAMSAAAGTFGCLVVFTVCPVTVLFVMAAHGIAGMPGAWSAVALLVTLPGLVAAASWIHDDRRN